MKYGCLGKGSGRGKVEGLAGYVRRNFLVPIPRAGSWEELNTPLREECDKRTARVSSLSLVRYRGSDYSVPTEYGYREVLVKGYVEEVVIACQSEIIARHYHSYDRRSSDPLYGFHPYGERLYL